MVALLADIAALAGVRGLVSSTWRRRWARPATPFPDPSERVGSREFFDLADDADPHDGHLYRELTSLGGDLSLWAGRTGEVVEAAFGVRGALAALSRHRGRLGAVSPAGAWRTRCARVPAGSEHRRLDRVPEPLPDVDLSGAASQASWSPKGLVEPTGRQREAPGTWTQPLHAFFECGPVSEQQVELLLR